MKGTRGTVGSIRVPVLGKTTARGVTDSLWFCLLARVKLLYLTPEKEYREMIRGGGVLGMFDGFGSRLTMALGGGKGR